jgi:hypothetical protein
LTEFPTEFLATALNVYAVPFVNPITSHPVLGFAVTHVNPPGEDVTT